MGWDFELETDVMSLLQCGWFNPNPVIPHGHLTLPPLLFNLPLYTHWTRSFRLCCMRTRRSLLTPLTWCVLSTTCMTILCVSYHFYHVTQCGYDHHALLYSVWVNLETGIICERERQTLPRDSLKLLVNPTLFCPTRTSPQLHHTLSINT